MSDGGWLMVPLGNGAHVLPLQEVTRHELDEGCWCGPCGSIVSIDELDSVTRMVWWAAIP
jgi:hypothetical protein